MSQLSSPGRSAEFSNHLHALRRAQKPSTGTAAYGRYVNRPLGRVVAAASATVGLTPNGATVISATLSGLGIALLALAEPTLVTGLGVALLLAAGYVMDSVDGQLARLTGTGSVSGEWLDHTIDCFKTSMLHLAVLIAWYRYPPVDDDRLLLVPMLYEVVQVVTFFGLILMPYLRVRHPKREAAAIEARHESSWRPWLILPTDYGFLCWTFITLGWPTLFASIYGALALLNAAALAAALRKWWRELRSLELPS